MSGLTARERALAAAVLAGALGTLSVGTATAYWRTSGSGDGTAGTATSLPAADVAKVTTLATTTATLLHPGGTGDLAVAVRNTNSYAITVSALTPTASGAAGCTTPALTVGSPTGYKVGASTVTLPLSVPAGSTTTVTLVGAVSMGAASNDCQGKTLSLPVTINWTG